MSTSTHVDPLPAPCGGCDVPLFRHDPWVFAAGAHWCIECAEICFFDPEFMAEVLAKRWERGGGLPLREEDS